MFQSLVNKKKCTVFGLVTTFQFLFWWYQEKKCTNIKNEQILALYYDINQKWTVQNYKKLSLAFQKLKTELKISF